MSVTRIDALVDALATLNGALDPRSDAYQLRNPLLLKAFRPKDERDKFGRRIFKQLSAGFDNGRIDLIIKCSGKSSTRLNGDARLTPDSTLTDLCLVFGHTAGAARTVKNFLRAALKDADIRESQKLEWFLEGVEHEQKY